MFKLQGTNAFYTCKFLSLSYTTRITLCLTTCISWTVVISHMLSVSMMIGKLLSLFNNSVIDFCIVSVLPDVHACVNFASSYHVNSHLIGPGSKSLMTGFSSKKLNSVLFLLNSYRLPLITFLSLLDTCM